MRQPFRHGLMPWGKLDRRGSPIRPELERPVRHKPAPRNVFERLRIMVEDRYFRETTGSLLITFEVPKCLPSQLAPVWWLRRVHPPPSSISGLVPAGPPSGPQTHAIGVSLGPYTVEPPQHGL
jgi:hypothetical protein